MFVYKGKPERMREVGRMGSRMRGHAVREVGLTKLVDFAIDRTLEAYGDNPSGLEKEYQRYRMSVNGQRPKD